jgi:hypothetical protein
VRTYLVARWYVYSSATPGEACRGSRARGRGGGEAPTPTCDGLVVRRLDRTVATGFLLTLALSIALLGGLALGVLAFLVRRVAFVQRFDNLVAAWGYDHRSATSTDGLHAFTDLGSLEIVVVLAIALVAFKIIRSRDRWSFLFLLTVLVGMEAITLGVKDLVGRVRPTLDPAAASLGPKTPQGEVGHWEVLEQMAKNARNKPGCLSSLAGRSLSSSAIWMRPTRRRRSSRPPSRRTRRRDDVEAA